MTVTVHLGDCRDVLRSLPAQSVDCVVTDPPYGETSLDWDRQVSGWLDVVQPLLKPHGSIWVFGSLKFFMDRAADFRSWNVAQDIIWEKHNGTNTFNDRFRRVHEMALHLYPRGVLWRDVYKKPLFTNDATARAVRRKKRPPQWGDIGEGVYVSHDGGPRLMRSVMFARSCHGHAVHPTQKPEAIIAPLIEYSTPPGGVVLDPFGGSGTTGVVADRLGRHAILAERQPEYAAIAQHRIELEQFLR